MAATKRRARKKNISGGAGIAIGIAIGVGVTALGGGVYMHMKKKKDQKAMGNGANGNRRSSHRRLDRWLSLGNLGLQQAHPERGRHRTVARPKECVMAKRRRRKKNPTTAQWVVLGVGGAVGLGLLGYGVSLALKNRKVEKQLGGGSPEGSGAPGQEWQYTLRRGFRRPRKGKGRKWMATVYEPGGRNPQILPGYETREAADDAAKVFITSRGGVPVFREKKDDVVQVFDGFVAIPMS